ncbi:MAG: EAL domain-containing protein [Betaproteobacteria bacterium]|nr:EAL domain-containing protein [Betaproteobacteria bacterium]
MDARSESNPATPRADPHQAVRLQRFCMALVAYAIGVALMAVASSVKLIAPGPLLFCIAAISVANAAIYGLFRSGANLRFADPSLTLVQSLAGIALIMLVAYSFDRDRSLVLVWCLVVLLFGVFRFKPREFGLMTLFMLAGYAAVINVLMYQRPQHVDVFLEWYQWLWLALILPAFAMVGSRISELRARILRTNDELTNALSTIQNMATHDSLTGLPNRASLADTMAHAINRAERGRESVSVLFVDLDHFKAINDSLGHSAGDHLLREVARRLSAAVRDSDLVARLGGDEFVVMVENAGGLDSQRALAEKIIAAVHEPMTLLGHQVTVSASIGIASFPEDGKDPATLLSNADLAMYRAKDLGRHRAAVYAPELGQTAQERFEIETDMRKALEAGEFRLYYQPKIDFQNGRMLGVEALIRWHHPRLGVLGPDRFIPIAEESNFIVPLGDWIIEQACRQARAWQDSRLPAFTIAVNLSARQIADEKLKERLAGALKRTGANPSMIELEITETAVMRDVEEAVALLESLRGLGVKLSIDDFGTGYSSLSYLKQLPVDILKVDRAFVRDLPHNRDDLAITRAVIAMAHGLSMRVVAEGVEDAGQYQSLLAEGCDEFQGFYCRAAMEGAELEQLVRKHGLVLPVGG